MKYSNENEWYTHFKLETKRLKKENPPLKQFENHRCYTKIEDSTAQNHIIGEVDYSVVPLKKIHKKIIPHIEKDPSSWLILSEDTSNQEHFPSNSFVKPYLKSVAQVLDVPIANGIENIFSLEARNYIRRHTKISDKKVLQHLMMLIEPPEEMHNPWEISKYLANKLHLEYADAMDLFDELMRKGPPTGNVNEVVKESWKQYSQDKLKGTVAHYNRPNIVAVVAIDHMNFFARSKKRKKKVKTLKELVQ